MTSTRPRLRDRLGGVLPILGLVIAASLAGYLVGSRSSATIRTGQAHSADGAISIVTDDWAYSVPLDGVMWTDRLNSLHESGRPDCLPPAAAPIQVRFASVEVTVDESTWRPVVWVDCR